MTSLWRSRTSSLWAWVMRLSRDLFSAKSRDLAGVLTHRDLAGVLTLFSWCLRGLKSGLPNPGESQKGITGNFLKGFGTHGSENVTLEGVELMHCGFVFSGRGMKGLSLWESVVFRLAFPLTGFKDPLVLTRLRPSATRGSFPSSLLNLEKCLEVVTGSNSFPHPAPSFSDLRFLRELMVLDLSPSEWMGLGTGLLWGVTMRKFSLKHRFR